MQDRIKFRAWIKDYGMLVPIERINFDCETIEVFLSPEDVDVYEFTFKEADIMQCTALRDINGKLIWESDIVKWGHMPNSIENPIRIAEVKQCPDIQFHSNVGVFHYGSFIYADTENHLEKIGNIYENPELLEGGAE